MLAEHRRVVAATAYVLYAVGVFAFFCAHLRDTRELAQRLRRLRRSCAVDDVDVYEKVIYGGDGTVHSSRASLDETEIDALLQETSAMSSGELKIQHLPDLQGMSHLTAIYKKKLADDRMCLALDRT